MQSMVPVYQKHLTKGDIDSIVGFYSTPTGQKVLREMPAMMAEAMQAMMPLIRSHMDAMKEHMQREVAQMMKEHKPSGDRSPTVRN